MSDGGGSESIREGATSSAAPIKRKRGRPRKNPLPADGSGANAGTSIAIATLPVGDGRVDAGEIGPDHMPQGFTIRLPARFEDVNGPAAVPVVKRKRGRPRKNPMDGSGVSVGPVGVLALEPSVGTGVVGRVDAPVKRGPGRPRKNPLPGAPAVAQTRPDSLPVVSVGVPGPVAEPVKRKRGRPRKQPVTGPAGPVRSPGMPVSSTPAPVPGILAKEDAPGETKGLEPGKSDGTGTGLVDRFGIGPGNTEGIGFWPPKPEEIESVRTAAASAGVVSDRRRGRRPKNQDSTEKAPLRPIGRTSFGADVEGKPFCGKCGTYTRVIQPERGPARRVCPKCHPEKVPVRKSPLDKTGMPCRDRGVCRPERCVMAFECEEMKRGR